ncbi:MAG: hypothetical protein ACRDPO_09775, partial [Streptosporangiaceae bacterium]
MNILLEHPAAGVPGPLLLHGRHPVPGGHAAGAGEHLELLAGHPLRRGGFGTGYLDVTEPGGIQMISPGGTATFEY